MDGRKTVRLYRTLLKQVRQKSIKKTITKMRILGIYFNSFINIGLDTDGF